MFKAITNCNLKCESLNEWPRILTDNKFYIAKIYKNFQGQQLNVWWRKILYSNYARPRASFTLWMACHQRLATKDRLSRFGIANDGLCCFCGNIESTEHLFFACGYTNTIWRKVLTWMQVHHAPGCWTDELSWLVKATSGKRAKAKILKIAAAETLYALWIARNKKSFSGDSPPDTMAYDICKTIVVRCGKNVMLNAYVQRLDGRS